MVSIGQNDLYNSSKILLAPQNLKVAYFCNFLRQLELTDFLPEWIKKMSFLKHLYSVSLAFSGVNLVRPWKVQ